MGQSSDTLIRKIKRLEQQLARQSDYRLIVEKNPIGISIIKDNRFIYTNRKFRNIFGLSGNGQVRVSDIAAEKYKGKIKEISKHLQANGSRSIQLEFKYLKKQKTITCLGIFSHISFEGSSCIQLVARDITRRNKLEKEIFQHYRASEDNLKRLDALYKISEQINEQKNFKNIIEKVITFCLNLTGATSGLVCLKNFKKGYFEIAAMMMPDGDCQIGSKFHLSDHALPFMNRSSKIKTYIYNKENMGAFKLPKGHFPIESCMIVPLIRKKELIGFVALANKPQGFSRHDEKLIKAFANHINIAIKNAQLFKELKTSYTTLKNTELKLIQSEKIAGVGLLAAGIAHEFNNIMSNIYLYAQLSHMDPDSKDSLVEVALTQSKRAMNITKALLSFSKRKEGILEYIDLTKVIEEIIRLTRKEIDRQDILIKREFSPIPHTLIDTAAIQQVFLNMIINARDAIKSNGIITIKTKNDDKWIYITFEDNGCGIAKEDLPRIFDPFFSTKTEDDSGSGLGLYVSYNFAKEADGDIQVKSKLGKGAQFLIRLPIREERRKLDQLVLVDRRGIEEKTQKYKILAINSNDNELKIIKKVLEDRQHKVWSTSTGKEALALFKKKKIDYIILDIFLSGHYNGFQIFRKIKKINPSTKIIFLTDRPEELSQYTDKTETVLKKPIEIKQLINAIV
jgi:PAS domain S-box-containing protein